MYIWHRILRLPGTEHSIAAGFAAGAAISFTPFLGFHFILAFLLAWMVRGNLVAAAIGTAIGNPWTFPFVFALTGEIGASILGDDIAAKLPHWSWSALMNAPLDYLGTFWPLVFPLVVGSIPVGIFVWFLTYFAVKGVVATNREKKLQRRAAKCARTEQGEALKNDEA